MAYNWAPYQTINGCSTGPKKGAMAVQAYFEDRFDFAGSYGIYNCRPPSTHSEGRAGDTSIPTGPGGSARPELGDQILELVGPHAKRLGFTDWIYNRKIWSARSPQGRYYGGSHPHYNHIHWSLTRAAAEKLNYATLVAVLGSANAAPRPAPDKSKGGRPYPGYGGPYGGYNRPEAGPNFDGNVKWIQEQLDKHLPDEDGRFGEVTELKVKLFQTRKGLDVDGVVGPKTWRALA